MSSSSSSRFRRSAAGRGGDHNDNNHRSHRSSSNQQQSTSRSNLNNGNGGGTLGISTTTNSFRTTRRHHHRPGEVTPTMANNDAPAAAAVATVSLSVSQPPVDVQGDLVDYGMSLNVKDEQRRDIQVEITVIATSNGKTNKSLGEETKTEEQIKKGLGHAKNEQCVLNKGASDQLESTKDYSDFTKELDQRFKSGIVECTTPAPVLSNGSPSSSSSSNSLPASLSNLIPITPDGRINQDHHSNGNNEEERGGGDTSSRESNRRIVDGKNALGDTILRTLQKEDRDIKDSEIEQENLNERRVQLEQSMELQGLRASLEREQGNIRRLQSEVQQDRDAKSTRVVEIQQSHESSGTKAQKIIDLTKRLNEAKNSNAEEEAKGLQKVQAMKAEIESLRKVKEEKMMKSEQQKRKIQECTKQMDDLHAYRKAREDFESATVIRSERKKELLARQIDIQNKLEEQQRMQHASLTRKEQAKEAANAVQAKKKENSDIDTSIIVPGKAEMAALAEEKMKIACQIGNASKNSEQAQTREQEALVTKMDASKDVKEQVEQLESNYAKLSQELQEKKDEYHAFHHKLQEGQIKSHKSVEDKFSKMYEAEEKVFDEKYEERRAQLSQELQERKDEFILDIESNEAGMHMLEAGKNLLSGLH